MAARAMDSLSRILCAQRHFCIQHARQSLQHRNLEYHALRGFLISPRSFSNKAGNDHSSTSTPSSQQVTDRSSTPLHPSQPIPVVVADDFSHRVISKLSKIESRMKFRGYSVLRIGLGIVFLTGAGIYIFREYIRENVADEVSTVASRSLSDETLKLRAHELSVALLEDLLDDANMQTQAVLFLRSVFHHQDTQESLKKLFSDLLKDPETQVFLSQSLKQVVTTALSDEEFRQFLIVYLRQLVEDEQVRQSLMQLVATIFHNDFILQQASEFAKDVLATDKVQQEGVKLGQYIASGVVADDSVQKQTGDALWNAFTYSVKPTWITGWLPSWMGGATSSKPVETSETISSSTAATTTTTDSVQPPPSDQMTPKPAS